MAGEVVRAAAKLIGVPVIPGGVRGKAVEHLPVSSSTRMPFSARPPVSAITSEAAGEPMPIVVFHGVPTLEEANEATSELILGIEKIYLSRGEITTEPAVSPIVDTDFRLLRRARNAVASLARDQNVLKAVRENQQVQEFLHSEKRRWASMCSITGAERLVELCAEGIEYPSNDAESKPGFRFENLLKTIQNMVDMIKNVSDLFKNLFGHEGPKSSADDDQGSPAPEASAEHVIEASLLGLAIMVIMLIFLKRG